MANLVTDIMNQALDAIGADVVLGDAEDGTKEAQTCLRAYGQCRKQLLRAANWQFARKQAPMVLLADATGQTPAVGTIVPKPWIYEYEYPIDCMKMRFVPWQFGQTTVVPPGNIQTPQVPLMTGMGQSPLAGARIRPARFLVASDFNYPPLQGQITWEVQGVSPQARTVVLTNVQCAEAVYTADMLYPSIWDALFRAAMVAYLASEVALPLSKDKKFGLALRKEQIEIVKAKVIEARLVDGNETWSSSDIPVDWIDSRRTVGGWPAWGNRGGFGAGDGGIGVLGYGWDSLTMCDGSAF